MPPEEREQVSPVPSAPAEPAVTKLAASYGGEQSTVTRVVLHDEEFNVGPDSAEQIAAFFAAPSTGTSAHYVVDADSVQHCVPEHRIAYHAPPNVGSVGIEHDGFGHFTAADWATPGSQATLARSAVLTAGICQRWGIPVRFLTAADLKANPQAKGITFHSQVSAAFGESTHTDPGDHFPIDAYLAAVTAAMTPAPVKALPETPAPGEEDMPKYVVIEAPGRSPAFLSDDGVAHPMGSGGWTFVNRLSKKHPGVVLFDNTWTAAEYDLVAKKG
jgi:N-acetyl-anhydromuramyl-L-alanine amidase AmpD